MESSHRNSAPLSGWERFLQWLNGSKAKTSSRAPTPRQSGETEIYLSNAQRKKLEEAVNIPETERWETNFYRRDTTFQSRPAAEKPSPKKDGLII